MGAEDGSLASRYTRCRFNIMDGLPAHVLTWTRVTCDMSAGNYYQQDSHGGGRLLDSLHLPRVCQQVAAGGQQQARRPAVRHLVPGMLHCSWLCCTALQCAVTVAGCYVLRAASRLLPGLVSFPDLTVRPATVQQVLPLSAVFVGMITFNNLCLKDVGVSFYYIGR